MASQIPTTAGTILKSGQWSVRRKGGWAMFPCTESTPRSGFDREADDTSC